MTIRSARAAIPARRASSSRPARPTRAVTPTASARVLDEWTRRIEAEYRSAALTQQLGYWLIVAGAPEWLVRDSIRITSDELAHARLSHAVATRAGLTAPPALDRASLGLARHPDEPLEDDLARVVLEGYCLGETIAVRLFSAMRRHCDVPVARRALDRILRDEVRHRDFGWNALAWLLAIAPERTAALVGTELPRMLEGQRRAYAPEGLELERSLPKDELRWGLLPGAGYCAITASAPTRDYAPRLKKLGLVLPR